MGEQMLSNLFISMSVGREKELKVVRLARGRCK
jgi:hypothetical protein